MKISKLHIVNFLKLRDVEINPSKTNVIVGKNKQGKTSIVKAIEAAFDGKLDPSAIHVGADKAEITIDLDDMTIKRTVTEKGTYLDISNKEGMKMPSPQKWLDGILGSFSFNPVEFFNMKPADQRKALLEAVKMQTTPDELIAMVPELQGILPAGIEWGQHALEVVGYIHKELYKERTVANAEVTKKRKSLDDTLAKIPDGFDPASVSEENIANLRTAIETDKLNREKSKAHDEKLARMRKEHGDIEAEIQRLKEKSALLKREIEEEEEVTFDTSDDMTISAAEESLAKLEGQRETVFAFKRAEEIRNELSTAVGAAEKLDAVVTKLTKDVPAALIQKASLPVEGIAVSESGITLNGIAIENLSSSEQLRFALAITRALNDKFKVVCIDGIELLDKENFELFLKEVEQDDFQYFITRVDGEGENAIHIEDGVVKTA